MKTLILGSGQSLGTGEATIERAGRQIYCEAVQISRGRMAWRSALSKNLQELRISLSQTSPGSQVSE